MWIIKVRSPDSEPKEFLLKSGETRIGRMSDNDIIILDPSASRYHAKINFDTATDLTTIVDLGSTNGTYINREKISSPTSLNNNDIIRIGSHVLEISHWGSDEIQNKTIPSDTQELNREAILESLDQHSFLLTEAAERLNSITDLDSALLEVANLMKSVMGADYCKILLDEEMETIESQEVSTSIIAQAIESQSAVIIQDARSDLSLGKSAFLLRIQAALCVPILSKDNLLGVIYVHKNRERARPFVKRDIQLAVAIAHLAAMTIERMRLLEKVKHDEIISNLLHRILSPEEASYIYCEYMETGNLPVLSDYTLTILVADICNSTGLSERLGAKRFARILSRYYEDMTKIIFSHHGMLNKFVGDGIMAVFGLPHQPPEPERRAVKAALDMLAHLNSINKCTGENLEIGIGINSGPAMAGYIGTPEYSEFAVIGYPVNIAWKLEEKARPNRIYIGHPTFQAINSDFQIKPVKALDSYQGIDEFPIYEVVITP